MESNNPAQYFFSFCFSAAPPRRFGVNWKKKKRIETDLYGKANVRNSKFRFSEWSGTIIFEFLYVIMLIWSWALLQFVIFFSNQAEFVEGLLLDSVVYAMVVCKCRKVYY